MTVLLLLKQLRLEKRRPYQTRHTTATIWLAAGEAPECSASHMTTLRLISSNSMISGAEIEQLTTLGKMRISPRCEIIAAQQITATNAHEPTVYLRR